jgi:hypothetical protein
MVSAPPLLYIPAANPETSSHCRHHAFDDAPLSYGEARLASEEQRLPLLRVLFGFYVLSGMPAKPEIF